MKTVNGLQIPELVDEPGSHIPWKNTKLVGKINALDDTLTYFANGQFPAAQIGDETNYFSIDTNGRPRLFGNATQWKAMTTEGSATKLGSLNKPDFDFTNVGLLFPQNDTSEKIYIVGALQDDYKEGSDAYVVIQFVQASVEIPTWKVDFRLNKPGYPIGTWMTITANTVVLPYIDEPMVQYAIFPVVDGTFFKIWDEFDARVYRDDNTVSGDVLFKRISVYYEVDSIGADERFIKYPV